MTLTVWLSLALVCALGAMSPGPSLVVMVRHSLAGGRLHGIVAAWAHALGVGLYAVLTLLGLAVILKESPTVFSFITYAGAAYLAWLGVKSLRAKGGVAAKLEKGEKTTLLEAARDGAMISVLNRNWHCFSSPFLASLLPLALTPSAAALSLSPRLLSTVCGTRWWL